MLKRVETSEAILALLDTFQEDRSCISNGKPELLLYLMFVFASNLMKSRVVYAAI